MDWREKYLNGIIHGKDVLDLGAGNITDRFLHRFINDNARSCVGIEIDEAWVRTLNEKGYNILKGNAENIKLNKKFDVIIAGDLIEHIDNPGLFLDNVKIHLKKNGVFIFNTPNPYSIKLIIRAIMGRGHVRQFPEHTYLFTEDLLRELLGKHKFRIEKIVYFTHPDKYYKSRIVRFFSLFSKKWNENIQIEAVPVN